jgi:hypothetical protein
MSQDGDGRNDPICSQQDALCRNPDCRHYIDWFETGNCTLRFNREHTLAEIGIAFGFTRQRAEQVINGAIRRYRRKYIKLYGHSIRRHQHT